MYKLRGKIFQVCKEFLEGLYKMKILGYIMFYQDIQMFHTQLLTITFMGLRKKYHKLHRIVID